MYFSYGMEDSATETRRIAERYQKAIELKEIGVNPYPYSFEQKDFAEDILKKHESLKPEEKTTQIATIAGRIMTFRRMGKAGFAHIMDKTGKLQVYFRKDDLGDEQYEIVSKLDIGDIVGIEGTVFKTKMGEITLYVSKVTLLTKALRDLPEKYHGLKDTELRFRQRYVDMITNTHVRDTLVKRSVIVKAIREYFEEHEYLEVETPLLQTQYGGANARPFKTHINAWDMPMFLSISPEMYLKRYMVGGFERIFTICKNFRNEGVDHSHNPEFTMLEAYCAYKDYDYMMEHFEKCIEYVALKVNGTTKTTVTLHNEDGNNQEVEIDLKAPWKRQTMAQAIQEHVGIDVLQMSFEELDSYCRENKIEPGETWGSCVMHIFDELVEEKIVQPTHIYDRPVESTPLCKEKRGDSRLIEQCEPIIARMEVGNIYSELNNPVRQRELLEEQANQLRGGDEEAHPMDEDFVKAIEFGLPPTAGLGFGVDRIVMILTGVSALRDIIAFPTVKPKSTKAAENAEK